MRKSDLRQDFTQVLTSPPLSDTTLIMNRMQTILTFAVAFVAIAPVNSAAVDGSEHHSSQDRVLHGQPLSRDVIFTVNNNGLEKNLLFLKYT